MAMLGNRSIAIAVAGFVVITVAATGQLAADELPAAGVELDELTPEAIRSAIPERFDGSNVEVMRMQQLYSFPTTNYLELEDQQRTQHLKRDLEAIVVADGVYGLSRLNDLIDDPDVFEQTGPDTFTARRPIFVTPTATVVVRNQTLRLAIDEMAAIIYHGDLFVVDAVITTWDESRGDYGPREEVDEDELLLFGVQRHRPYLLGLRGSRSYFAASTFRGLGYNGRSGSFGISLTAYGDPPAGRADSLNHLIAELPRPTGVLVGNTITEAFFGFYTNHSASTVLVGNVFSNNVVYGPDLHDDSDNAVIERNLVVGTRHKHGIIFSRDVHAGRIAGNITAGNSGSGIMLDRSSDDVEIERNISLVNNGDGIAVFESDRTRIEGNLLFTNSNNGIHLRNSINARVRDNTIDRNGHYGIEAATRDLNDPLRDTELDPYRKRANASIVDNALHRNLAGAVTAKGRAGLFIQGNDLTDSAPQIFGGELEALAPDILRANRADGFTHEPESGEQP